MNRMGPLSASAMERSMPAGSLFSGSALNNSQTLAVKEAMILDAYKSGLSRFQIADRLAEELREPVSKSAIDCYLSKSKPHRFPAAWVKAWMKVTGSRRLREFAVDEEEIRAAEIGRLHIRIVQMAGAA